MNSVTLFGRLVRDVEISSTASGTTKAVFTLAVDRKKVRGQDKDDADFIRCIAWDKRAEVIGKFFSKGNRMLMTGKIRTGSYTDKKGNTVYTFDVWLDDFEFIDAKGQSRGSRSNYSSPMDSFGEEEVNF